MATDMDNLNRFVAQKNLERLQHYDITLTDPASDSNAIIGDKWKLAYSILKKWSDKNPDSIKKAIEAQVFGQKNPIDWNIAFLPFMESMAVYLRDYGKILAACEKYAQCQDPEVDTTPEDLEDAISTYISAADEINNVAKLWGMKFMQICDLPRGTSYKGVTIFNDKAPQDIASEINGLPPPGRKFTSWKEFKRDVIDAGPHLPNSYYKSMVEAIKTTAKKETTEGNGF
ncbi:hypothetical protein FOXG_03695 [Fusarium oxysporum f. sp. lycopersici 4287]|uniref:Uncharacterized protein n=2 Tax=Fusarium oxysporum TaxID=5507 RepID=A0A0J9UL75_FUSO4|nr:hypothetical protein FOXG_03695 [Fusarium oxysporum f. sp. lycopersici 4287]KNA99999.1 hypothetical protein FOXG_03695 [Fusarium oxysporum f. sp. lycopersici 4287]